MQTPSAPAVVVGVSGSAASLAAVRLGAREAMARDRMLRVVHAFSWPQDRSGTPPQGYAQARRDAGKIIDKAVAAAERSTPGVRVSGVLIDGQPTRVLLQQSRTADLLVLGDDDLALTGQVAVDSVLLQAVSRAFCPAIVARGPRPPSGPLLAAVDGSPDSLEALRFAAGEAALRGAPIVVAHVVDQSGAEARGRAVLDAAVAAVPQLRNARKRLIIGDPATALVCASRKARMVLAGPRGSDKATLLGPVAHELLRRGACPTLFVHGTTATRHW
ncbi:MAG TPA: universal stress protein [Actinoplanes sp.]|nr:universal stress protein [Actinoplanes sp.]